METVLPSKIFLYIIKDNKMLLLLTIANKKESAYQSF